MSSDTNLKKLEGLVQLVTEGLTREEFVSAFEQVVLLVKKMEMKNRSEMEEMQRLTAEAREKFGMAADKLEMENSSNFKEEAEKMKEKVHSEMNLMLKNMEASHSEMKEEMEEMMRGMKMMMPDEDEIVERAKKETKKEIKIPEELSGEKVRNKLELLKGEDRLDKSAVKGLEDLEKYVYKIPTGRVVAGAGMNLETHERFDVGASTTTITLQDAPGANGNAISLYYNGVFLPKGAANSYTVNGKVITLNFTPEASTVIDVTYRTMFRSL